MKFKNILINFLILISSLVFIILFLEFITRIFLPQKLIYYNNDVWKPDDGLGWSHYKNINTVLNPGGGGIVNFITDPNGFRIGKSEDKEFEYEVLIIGDSFLEAFQVENKFIIPSLLKEKFYSEYNKKIKFYNTAVSGWNPNQYLIQTKRFLKKYKPDLGLIFLYSSNDLIEEKVNYFEPKIDKYPSKFKIPKSFKFKDITNSILLPINDFLETRFHLFILFKSSFEITLSKVGLTHYSLSDIFYKNQLSVKKSEITAEICNKIKLELQKKGVESLFIILPAAYQVDQKLFYNYLKGFNIDPNQVDLYNPNKLLKQSLAKYNIILLDPIELFIKSNKLGIKTHGKIDRHFNKKGHEITSEYLYPYLKEEFM